MLKLSLADCLRLADEGNAKLHAKDFAIEGAQWQYDETKIRFRPVFDLTDRMAPVPRDAADAVESFFSGDVTFFNSAKLGVGVPVYAFGKITYARWLAGKGIEAARENKERDKNEIHFQVAQLYYGILLGSELKALAEDAIQKVDNQLESEEETKQHSPYEITKLKVFRLELKKKLNEAIEKSEVTKEALRIQLGFYHDQPFELADRHLNLVRSGIGSLEGYLDSALNSSPDAKLVDIGVKAKEFEWKLERKKILPSLGLGGFAEIGRTTDNIRNLRATDDFNNPFNFTRAGVGLELKGQFDVHSAHARTKRLHSEYNKIVTEQGLAKEGIALEVKEAYQEAKIRKEDLKIVQERERLAHQMIFLSKSNLDLGVGEEQDYADALQLYLLTEVEYFKSVFDYNVAVAKLEWKTGGGR